MYPKIENVFLRNHKTNKPILWEFSNPLFRLDCVWDGYEKIDGTNVRVVYEQGRVVFKGRRGKSEIPIELLDALTTLFSPGTAIGHARKSFLIGKYPYADRIVLYGEGFGGKIQNAYGQPVRFALFDIQVDNVWLTQEDVSKMAKMLDILRAPWVFKGDVASALKGVKTLKSVFADVPAEGLVLRPELDLRDKYNVPIKMKAKRRDFES